MARNRRKKALYEVMSKARLKPGYSKTLDQVHPRESYERKLIPDRKSAVEMPKTTEQWWKKRRIVQFNAGRIEFSVPYQLAVLLLLGLILLVLAAFRFGQFSYPAGQQEATEPAGETPNVAQENPAMDRATAEIMRPSAPATDVSPKPEEVEPVTSTGENVIVLVEYGTLSQLVPVREHFVKHGIETEIVMENGRYLLQTEDRYDNPATPGTDGYKAKQRITEVGAKYRAPAGHETFAPNFFSDAYGKKVK